VLAEGVVQFAVAERVQNSWQRGLCLWEQVGEQLLEPHPGPALAFVAVVEAAN